MNKAIALTGLLLALAAPARAAGLNLAWDNCPSTLLSSADAVDPCDNSGLHQMLATAVVPSGLNTVVSEECYLDMQVAADVLPDFWHMETGGCRDGSLLVNTSFAGFNTISCKNYWGTSASGGFYWQAPFTGEGGAPNRARLSTVFARTLVGAGAMTAGLEYYLIHILIDGNHAVEDAANGITLCAGCDVPACWVFNTAYIQQPVGYGGDAVLTEPATRNYVTWQGGGGTGCPTAVPARRATWGQVKSLYR